MPSIIGVGCHMEVVQYWQTGRLGAVWSGFWLAGVSGSRCVTVGIDGIRFSDEAARRAVAVCLSGREEPVFVSSFRSSGGRAYLIVDGVLGEVVVKVSHGSLSQRLLSVTRWAALTDSALLSPLCSPCSVFDPVYGELLVSFFPYGSESSFSDADAWVSLGDLIANLHGYSSCGVPGFDQCAGLGELAHEFAGTRFELLCAVKQVVPAMVDGWRRAAACEPSVVCHGEAHARQVVSFSSRRVLIDFDRTGDGPAMSDLGLAWAWNEVGHLPDGVWLSLLERFRVAAPAHLVGGSSLADLKERVAPFGRIFLLRRAFSQAAVSLRNGDTPYVDGFLAAAARMLDSCTRAGVVR